jgi:cysteine synthase
VCSVGTGGTICGTGKFLKERDPSVRLIAVEPFGSTIFGGKLKKYLSAGAGMRHPSGIFKSHGEVVDYFCKVDDRDAIHECKAILDSENINVGITTGAVLVAARQLANRYPQKNIVAISPDGGEMYSDLIDHMIHSHYVRPKVELIDYIVK